MAVAPLVSVVIPVSQVEPYLRECLDSVVSQTIGLDRLEVLAIDDGSTDGSGEILDEYAGHHPEFLVVHQPNSGGPGGPRNVGLDRATGTYVFFLDADDRLGSETLERVVALAERNATDIVIPKLVGLDGRRVPSRAFRRDRDHARVDDVYSSLAVLKLFRRSLIERLALRFRDDVAGGEDAPFTARALLEADGISVLASYDGYFVRRRPGSQTRRAVRPGERVAKLRSIGERMELVANYRPPGRSRDRLMIRHIQDVLRPFRSAWRRMDEPERTAIFETAADLLETWHTPRMQRWLVPPERLWAWCLQERRRLELDDILEMSPEAAFDDPLRVGRRWFARYPHFRDGSGIPDACFRIGRLKGQATLGSIRRDGNRAVIDGEAWISPIGGRIALRLRRWPLGSAIDLPTTMLATPRARDEVRPYPVAGFRAAVAAAAADGARSIEPGMWALEARIVAAGVTRTVPIQVGSASLPVGGPLRFRRAPSGTLRVQVGRRRPVDAVLARADAVATALRRRVPSAPWTR